MSPEQQQLELAIGALESQRSVLGDAIVDSGLGAIRERLRTVLDEAPSESSQTLRQVSILFLDLVGSTALSQRLDPEAISQVLDGALASATAIVESHGGKVLQYAGDSLLAVFGAAVAREDDAERAVRCGLALLALGHDLGAAVRAEHGLSGFDLRIGIHTGSVLLGGGVDLDNTIRGTSVHIAARLEQTAPAGGLRISEDTYAQVRGVFDVAPQEPLIVKGIDTPLASFLVRRVKPRSFRVESRGIEGVATRMIGRDAELEALQAAFHRLVQEGARLERIAIVAEAGVGKSRLLYEFRNWAESREERFHVFQARAVPRTQGQAYGLLHDILAWRFEIGDNDSMDVARAKFDAALKPLFSADEGEVAAEAHVHLLGHLIGLDYHESRHIRDIRHDGRQIRARGFHAAAQAMQRIAAQRRAPLVLYIDDLHWADDASLDFIDYLADVGRDVPMLIVEVTRPALFERRGDADSGRIRIDLRALDRDISRLLADELLQKLPDIPAVLRELITGGADGNPFYMEELVKMLIAEGAIRTSDERWSLDANRLLALKVPSTLTGVLQARLDALPHGERRALQLASVIGLTFWDAALAHVEAQAIDQLRPLARRELVDRKDVNEAADDVHEYAFHHQILHQVTYDTVLRSIRRDAHAKTAEWLAERSGPRAKALLGTAAEHYEQAGAAAPAADFYARAAEHAASTFANEAALDFVARGLRLAAPDDHPLRWRLHDARERTLEVLGRRAERLEDIELMMVLADRIDDDARRAQAFHRRADVAIRTGDFAIAEAAARRAEDAARRAGDEIMVLRIAQPLAVAMAYQGDLSTARAMAEAALQRAEALGEPMPQARLQAALAICAYLQGDMVTNLHCSLAARSLYLRLGDRRNEAIMLSNSGSAYSDLGDHASAQRCLEEALGLNRALGDRGTEGGILGMLANNARHRGDAMLALTLARAAIASTAEVGARLHHGDALDALGHAELALGRFSESVATFEKSEEIALEVGASLNVTCALEGLLAVALARRDLPLACALMPRLLDSLGLDDAATTGLAASNGNEAFAGKKKYGIRLLLHKVWALDGDPRADGVLDEAHRLLLNEADSIGDALLRRTFLANIPAHHEIVALWTRAHSTSDVGVCGD